MLDDCDIHDIVLEGYDFTWARGRGTENFIEERIDRCLVDSHWLRLFPESSLCCLFASVSDHNHSIKEIGETYLIILQR